MKKKRIVIGSALVASFLVISLFAMIPLSSRNNTAKGSDWMKNVEDGTSLTSMSIPGSHDSGSFHSIGDVSGKCQDLSISEQLKAGIRFFDIRLQLRNDELKVIHGIVDQKLDFSSVLNDFESFLSSYPSEGLIVSVKKESSDTGSTLSFDEALKRALSSYSYWDTNRTLPETLGKLRGKAYLISRYSENSIGLEAYDGWESQKETDTENTFEIEDSHLHVQDYYQVKDIEMKKSEILSCLDYSAKNLDTLTLNFSSCYLLNSFPPTYAPSGAKIINPWLGDILEGKNNLGIIVSDFVTSDLSETIYKRNLQ